MATPPRLRSDSTAEVSDTLHDATHVFIRQDATRKSLQPPYDGPYKVLECATNHFIIDINGRSDTVAISRLKPAYLEDSMCDTAPSSVSTSTNPPHTQSPPRTASSGEQAQSTVRATRSGRHVHWPAHLADYFTQ